MSEADRVFSRMTTPGSLPSPENRQFLHITSRRRGAVAGQSHVVQVIHLRSGHPAPSAESASPSTQSAHAATWPEGFPGRTAPNLPSAGNVSAIPAPTPPVGHLMPGWEPLLAPRQPTEPVADIQAASRPRSPVTRPQRPEKQPTSTRRAFADPFAAEDSGTNCIRCGYLVSPAREKRGLMTCIRCR